MLSADIAGSTALTERLAGESVIGAERITTLLSGIFGQLIEVSTRFGGDVLEFSGDSMLVLFSGSNHQRAAAAAGVQMQRRLSSLELADEYGLTIRVGAHSDVFDVFLSGSHFKQLIVAGPSASKAITLESNAGAGNVLVSWALADALPSSWLDVETEYGWRLALESPENEPFPQPSTTVSDTDLDVEGFVNPVIVDELSNVNRLRGEHRPAAVAFLDVQGVDEMLTAHGGETTAAAVAAVLDDLVASAARYGATYLTNGLTEDGFKFTVLAGVPTSQGADLEALIRTMLEVLATETQLALRAGVTHGDVFAGFLGPPSRHEYAAMGDVVNLAARLLAEAEPGELITTPTVAGSLSDQLQTTTRPPMLPRGKTERIVPHRVLSIETGPGTAGGPMIDDDLLLFGREDEQRKLNELVERMAVGDFAFVGSEVGMGAHRLLMEIEIEPEDLVHIRCNRYDDLVPFASIRPALHQLLGIEDDDLEGALADLASSLPAELEPLMPLTGLVFATDLAETPESQQVTDLDDIMAKRAEVVIELLVMNLEGPTMLLVEDFDFADSASCSLLESIGQATDIPLVTVLSGPFEAVELLSSPPPTRIDIGPIDDHAARELVNAAADGKALSNYQIDQAVERANGNPLFLIGLVRALTSGGELSESIDGLIRTGIDRLPANDRHLLRVASVLGAGFELEVLDRLLVKLGHTGWSAKLGSMPHLVEVRDGRAHFVRSLYRDVCYNSLPQTTREEIHLAAGLLMEESGRTNDSDLGVLALHFDEAADKQRAWQYSIAAGKAAAAGGAPVEAIASFQRALAAADHLETIEPMLVSSIQEALGDALFRSGSLKEAARTYAGATRVNDQDGRLRLMRQIGTVRERIGKLNTAELWYRRALSEIPDSTESNLLLHHRMQLQLAITGLRHRQSRHEELSAVARLALEDAIRLGDRPSIALAKERVLLGTIYGDGPADLQTGEEALQLYEELGDEHSRFKVLNNLAIAYHLRGQWDRALRRYQEAASAADGDVIWVGFGHNNRGEIFSNRGDFETASEELEQAARIWKAASYATGEAAAAMNIGLLHGRKHDTRPARRKLNDAIKQFVASGEDYEANEARLRLAEVLLISNQPRQADRPLDEVAKTEQIPRQQRILLSTLRGYSSLAKGQPDEAMGHLKKSEQLAMAAGAEYELALVRIAEAALNESEAELLRAKAYNAFVRMQIASPTPLIQTAIRSAGETE